MMITMRRRVRMRRSRMRMRRSRMRRRRSRMRMRMMNDGVIFIYQSYGNTCPHLKKTSDQKI